MNRRGGGGRRVFCVRLDSGVATARTAHHHGANLEHPQNYVTCSSLPCGEGANNVTRNQCARTFALHIFGDGRPFLLSCVSSGCSQGMGRPRNQFVVQSIKQFPSLLSVSLSRPGKHTHTHIRSGRDVRGRDGVMACSTRLRNRR